MSHIDQSRFNNQHKWIDALEAAALLNVKCSTLYSYVSRGLVRRRPRSSRGDGSRRGGHLYHLGDLERLVVRRDARKGHRAVAAAALRWGEPVLDTGISRVGAPRLEYRNVPLDSLIGNVFEKVAEHLWDPRNDPSGVWHCPAALRGNRSRRSGHPLMTMRTLVPKLAQRDKGRSNLERPVELDRLQGIIWSLASCAPTFDYNSGQRVAEAIVGKRRKHRDEAIAAIDKALVVIAEHGLNVSTFAARVTASAGADLYACISAALSALSGPLHGGACDQVEALLSRCKTAQAARQLVSESLQLGRALPCFGHPLYPAGDPRVAPLLAAARRLGSNARTRQLENLLAAGRRAKLAAPTVDGGLVMLTATLAMPPGSASALFAIGRAAGWGAHVFEQRDAAFMLRPRSRYLKSRP